MNERGGGGVSNPAAGRLQKNTPPIPLRNACCPKMGAGGGAYITLPGVNRPLKNQEAATTWELSPVTGTRAVLIAEILMIATHSSSDFFCQRLSKRASQKGTAKLSYNYLS